MPTFTLVVRDSYTSEYVVEANDVEEAREIFYESGGEEISEKQWDNAVVLRVLSGDIRKNPDL